MNTKIGEFEKHREFFQKVAKIVFTNPFSPERTLVDKEIVGDLANGDSSQYLLPRVIAVVDSKIQELDKNGLSAYQNYHKNDQELMRLVYLFEVYHKFINDFELFIQQQLNEQDVYLKKLSFASDIIALLQKRGFAQKESIHYIAIFYQLRRAFVFIQARLSGISTSMQQLKMSLWNNIFTNDIFVYEKYLVSNMEDFSTLLLGETGSGKGAIASAIGCCGYIPFDEKKQAFVASFRDLLVSVNLSQFSQGLIESELFGHRKGAFTGAINDHDGVFGRCKKAGAIFLDEIGEVPVTTQIKLLKILQERVYSRVGDYEDLRFSGRVIAATNKDINQLINEGKFREDFYYRLCSDVIRVPALATRIKEDSNELKVMLSSVVKSIVNENQDELTDKCLTIIKSELSLQYQWPGNVRELEQCVRSIFLTGKCHTPLQINKSENASWHNKMLRGSLNADSLLSHYCAMLYEREKSYEAVAQITELDRRTVKKYILGNLE